MWSARGGASAGRRGKPARGSPSRWRSHGRRPNCLDAGRGGLVAPCRERMNPFRVVLALAGALIAAVAAATPGDLDPTFGIRGVVALGRGPGNHIAGDVLVQPDGRIVVAAILDSTFAVFRLEPDGTLDATFGDGGITLVPEFGGEGHPTALVRQPDGKLVAAGSTRFLA